MRKYSLKTLTAICIAVMLTVVFTLTVSAEIYTGQFADVPGDAWYYDSVAQAYSMGIINGVSDTAYEPDGKLTIAECVKLAACIDQMQTDGTVALTNGSVNWYDTYVTYALEKGILSEPYEDYSINASRAQTAVIFSRLLEENETVLNTGIRQYCDVMDDTLWYYDSVYKMYRYGIMIGGNDGKFSPDASISRSEIAAVAVRMLDSAKRAVREISLAREVSVPILMYHDFAETAGDYTVTAEIFRSHLAALKEADYTAITFADLISYVDGVNNLPEKPVLLTSDDGYSGVLDVALPILKEYDMSLSVAVIGEHIGRRGDGRLPHFFLEEETERDTEDRIELVSHSYGLHNIANGMRGAVNETLEPNAYAEAVSEDCAVMRELAGDTFPMMTQVFVYPYGNYSADSESLLALEGYRSTVTTDKGIAVVSVGQEPVLLPRITAEWYKTGDELLKYMK